jgi:hypothetical protein
MTVGSIQLHKDNFQTMYTESATNRGCDSLINSIVSMANIEATFTMYKMRGCATIL